MTFKKACLDNVKYSHRLLNHAVKQSVHAQNVVVNLKTKNVPFESQVGNKNPSVTFNRTFNCLVQYRLVNSKMRSFKRRISEVIYL